MTIWTTITAVSLVIIFSAAIYESFVEMLNEEVAKIKKEKQQ